MRFRNVSGATQDLPTLDLRVQPDEEFDATGDAAKSLDSNPSFERVDNQPKSADKKGDV